MRSSFVLLLLITLLLPACVPGSPEGNPTGLPTLIFTVPSTIPTVMGLTPTQLVATESPKPAPTPSYPTPTISPSVTSGFKLQEGAFAPINRPLIAYQVISASNQFLLLADPAENAIYKFSLPAEAHFATPFLAGLSPDARYFVYFTGGQLENLYGIENLVINTPDLALHVLDLRNGKVIFSTPLLSPAFPQDLTQIAEKIKDDWTFANFDTPFEEVLAATQQEMLNYIRNVAWSPDSSLLAFAAQNPGPSSDLYFFSPEKGTAWRVSTDPAHILNTVWAPDSSTLYTVTSLYDQQAREDTTYMLSRDGSLLLSYTSQVWFFYDWHDSTNAFIHAGTDSGDDFEVKLASAADGTITPLWDGSYAHIVFTPDLSTFLVSSNMPSAPLPPSRGLFLGRVSDGSLVKLSGMRGWGVTYWGSERFAFAASSHDGGTIGITAEGKVAPIDDGVWNLAASPDHNYLAAYSFYLMKDNPHYLSGLRVFDENGTVISSLDDVHVGCVAWTAASSALAYQEEDSLYLWDVASGTSRLISGGLNPDECAFKWVQENP